MASPTDRCPGMIRETPNTLSGCRYQGTLSWGTYVIQAIHALLRMSTMKYRSSQPLDRSPAEKPWPIPCVHTGASLFAKQQLLS
jgi:hypothetical protein